MASRVVRTFSPTHNFTAKWIGGAAAVAGAIAVTVGVAAHAGTDADEEQAALAAKKILHAADTYTASSAQAGCPTITELVESRALEESSRMEDAWGNRFRIVCSESGPRVISAGRDGRMGTKDDLKISR